MLPLPRMGWAESGVWHNRLLMILGMKASCTMEKMPLPSGKGSLTKYRASSGPRSFVRRKRASASTLFHASQVIWSVEPFPRMLAPASGGWSSRFLMIGGKNSFCTI